jgi:hypothetical protein
LRLELVTSHLPEFGGVQAIYPNGRAPASHEIVESVKQSTSWSEALRRLGWKASGANFHRLQSAAESLGLDTSHFLGMGWSRKPLPAPELPFSREPSEANLHRAAIGVATSWFLSRGYMVSIPVETTGYDLIVESDSGLKRIQVKSTRSSDRTSTCHHVRIQRSSYGAGPMTPSAGKFSGRRAYTSDEIDLFFIYTSSGERYLIPVEETNGVRSLNLDNKYSKFRVSE